MEAAEEKHLMGEPNAISEIKISDEITDETEDEKMQLELRSPVNPDDENTWLTPSGSSSEGKDENGDHSGQTNTDGELTITTDKMDDGQTIGKGHYINNLVADSKHDKVENKDKVNSKDANHLSLKAEWVSGSQNGENVMPPPYHTTVVPSADNHLPGNGLVSNRDLGTEEEEEALLKKETTKDDNDVTVTIENESRALLYRISDNPPAYLILFFALQQCLMSLPSSVKVTVLVAEVMCAREEEWFKAQILSISLLMSGVCTLLQNTLGVRLPVYQGPISSYVIPLLALLDIPEFACPSRLYDTANNDTMAMNGSSMLNVTDQAVKGVPNELYFDSVIRPKFLQISGALMVAGGIHMLIGMTGMVGVLMRYIGPITVIPTMSLIALNVYYITAKFCATNWGIAALTASMGIVLSLYLDRRQMPIPVWNRERGFHVIRYPLHQVFAVLLAISFGWAICGILTAANVFTDDRKSEEFFARTDFRLDVVSKTPWLVFPYPGMYGVPTFSSGVFVAFMVGSITSIIDSIADYYACARVCRVPSPPVHAVNRGIMVEGFMSMIAGSYGASHATTTYGGNIGIIGITKVASRSVFQTFACCLIILAFLGKFASVFVTIPYPVLGGTQIIGFGIFIGLILANLQYIDLKSTRNMAIIGISILVGLMVPSWSKAYLVINTGNSEADNLIKMLMTNPNLAGGLLACFLDNTVPGTLEERGMVLWQAADFSDGEVEVDFLEDASIYEIPTWTKFLRKFKLSSKIPFFPTYNNKKNDKKTN